MIKLYGVPTSPYCRKLQLAMAYRGINYEMVQTVPGSDDEDFRRASPLGKIPAIVSEAGHEFADSSVIIAYYEKLKSERSLYPDDAGNYARALFFEEYADTKLSEVTSALYFQRMINPKVFGNPSDEKRVQELVSELIPAQLALLEQMMPESGWIAGDYSVADVAVGAMLLNLWHADFEIDASWYPRTRDFFNRFMQSDEVKRQLEMEQATFAHFEQNQVS